MDGIGPDITVLRSYRYDDIRTGILQGNASRSSYPGAGISCRGIDHKAAHGRIHNQVILMGIPVKGRGQAKSVHPKSGKLVIGASVPGGGNTCLLRHIVEHRNVEFKGRVLHIRCIRLGQPGCL